MDDAEATAPVKINKNGIAGGYLVSNPNPAA